jgi:ATP-dependent helicase IRC3
MPLRPKQLEALSAITSNYLKGTHRQVVSACTGFGKTVLFSHIPEATKEILPGQQVVLVHRDELLDQNIDKLRKYNPSLKVSKEKAEHFADPDADVLVASVQTLGREGSKRLDRFNWDVITKIITDEAHHATSDSYQNIYAKADVLRPDTPKLHVGCTATPNRPDGNPLAITFDKIVFNYPLREAMKDGWVVDMKGVRIDTNQSLDDVGTAGGDFKSDELAAVIDNPERNQIVVKGWLEYGEGRQTIGYTANILHAQYLADLFKEYGVAAEAIWGDDPLRARKLEAFRSGEITVLLNCALLVEGFDMWQVGCILLASPTKSGIKYTQAVGRGSRLEEGCPNLNELIEDCSMHSHTFKRDCVVIDYCDLSKRHNLTCLPTLFGLPAGLDLRGKSALWAVETLEEAQEKFAHIDFTSLKDIDKLKLYIEQVDLFSVKVLPEVTASSNFVWHSALGGGYVIMLPEHGSVKITQNLLDKYEIYGKIKDKTYRGERDSIADAFAVADGLVTKLCSESLKLVERGASWRQMPPKEDQMKLLHKLYKGKEISTNLTRGEVSDKIGEALAGKKPRVVPAWVKKKLKKGI